MKKLQPTGREDEHYCFIWPVLTFKISSTHSQTQEMRKIIRWMDALNAYFVPKVDTTYARHCFRQLTQAPGETIRQFATRLRRAARDCGYGADTDNQIRDEILCKCTSTYIKRKLLEEGQGLNLDRPTLGP